MSERSNFAVNVDVDSLNLYHAIHGIPVDAAGDAAWELGVPRFLDLFSCLGLKATFFVVAQDLERPEPRRVAMELVAAGHEIASHSWSHPYNLINLPIDEIRTEIVRAEELLGEVRGTPVRGFRAPGYNLSDDLLQVLADRGYRYDSSLFPCPPYFLARAAVISVMTMLGRKSASIVGDWSAPFSDPMPHQIAVGEKHIIEYPIAVVPWLRLPLIGTSLTLLGQRGIPLLAPAIARMPFRNIEFHALDLLDKDDPINNALVRRQRDLRTPVANKRAVFADTLKLCAENAQNETLEKFASSASAS
jgi:peptidoglycan/xylan/chitin deacetylase (PgdA/CDA1 family)